MPERMDSGDRCSLRIQYVGLSASRAMGELPTVRLSHPIGVSRARYTTPSTIGVVMREMAVASAIHQRAKGARSAGRAMATAINLAPSTTDHDALRGCTPP